MLRCLLSVVAVLAAGDLDLTKFVFKAGGDNVGYSDTDKWLYFLSEDEAEAPVKLDADGAYTIYVEASCQEALGEKAKFTLKIGDKEVRKDFELTGTEKKKYAFTVAGLKKGDTKLSIAFTNDAYKENEYDRNLYIHSVKVEPAKK